MEFPPGFGFYPSEELLLDYLRQRNHSLHSEIGHIIPDIDLYDWSPWQLPEQIEMYTQGCPDREEWYFFYRPKEKYRSSSKRLERTIPGVGYWKSTSAKKKVMSETTNEEMGIKWILVFYEGRSPSGNKSNWVIHEYHLHSSNSMNTGEMPFVACCLYKKTDKEGSAGSRTSYGGSSSTRHGTPIVQAPIYPNPTTETISLREVYDALSPTQPLDTTTIYETYSPFAGTRGGGSSFTEEYSSYYY